MCVVENVLCSFQGYSQCVDLFIEESQKVVTRLLLMYGQLLMYIFNVA